MAILENFQNEDGTVAIPEVLQPYMDNESIIGKSEKKIKYKWIRTLHE